MNERSHLQWTCIENHPTPKRLIALACCVLALPGTGLAASCGGVDLISTPNLTPYQAAAATANQNIYDTWIDCTSNTFNSNLNLTAEQQALFFSTQELVETRNEQVDQGPFINSLGLDEEGLADTLSWNANEETGAPGSIATKTINTQQFTLLNRLAAIRAGITGLSIAGLFPQQGDSVYALHGDQFPLRGGAAGSDGSLPYEGLGIFLNGNIGWGEQDADNFEDGFSYDSYSVTGGADYRFTDTFTAGAALTYSELDSDFDSSQSAVDGGVDSDSVTVGIYGTYNTESYYIDGLANYGTIDYDQVRRIKYPSLNPLIPPTNERAVSSTDSDQFSVSVGAGYDGNRGELSYSPYARFTWTSISIDGYTESGGNEFNLSVGDQEIDSAVSAVGLDITYTISGSNGVYVPFVRGEWLHEFSNDSESTRMFYVGAGSSLGTFNIESGEPDRNFFVAGAGISAVLRDGVQLFALYEGLLGYEDINSNVLSFGGRLEF